MTLLTIKTSGINITQICSSNPLFAQIHHYVTLSEDTSYQNNSTIHMSYSIYYIDTFLEVTIPVKY